MSEITSASDLRAWARETRAAIQNETEALRENTVRPLLQKHVIEPFRARIRAVLQDGASADQPVKFASNIPLGDGAKNGVRIAALFREELTALGYEISSSDLSYSHSVEAKDQLSGKAGPPDVWWFTVVLPANPGPPR